MSGFELDGRYLAVLEEYLPGATLLGIEPLAGGSSTQMVLVLAALDGRDLPPMVLRSPSAWALGIDANAAANEFALLRSLRDASLPVPRPLHLSNTGETSLLVLEYIEGAPELRREMAGQVGAPMARLLAAIHRADLGTGPAGFMPAHADQVERALEGSGSAFMLPEIAARWPFPGSEQRALLHGDFWPGNLLWRDAELVGVIDWEDSCLGHTLCDLAISRLDTLMIFGPGARDDLTRTYATLTGSDLSLLPHWELWAAHRMHSNLEWTSTWEADWLAAGRPDITEESAYACVSSTADEALAALRQA